MNELEALKEAIDICGGQTAYANKIGTKQGNVYYWLNVTHRVNANYVLKSVSVCENKISAHDFRPDLYPLEDSAA